MCVRVRCLVSTCLHHMYRHCLALPPFPPNHLPAALLPVALLPGKWYCTSRLLISPSSGFSEHRYLTVRTIGYHDLLLSCFGNENIQTLVCTARNAIAWRTPLLTQLPRPSPTNAPLPPSRLLFCAKDHGPENINSPDGALYMVGNGCLADKLNSNCSWISGDAVFLSRARAGAYTAADPSSLNNPEAWEFYCGGASQLTANANRSSKPGNRDGGGDNTAAGSSKSSRGSSSSGGGGSSSSGDCWTRDVAKAKPILTWKGRVGTVTATWHPDMARYLIVVTTPTVLPSTVGPYDTWVVETPSLTSGPFSLVSYMPRFGQQAYFVSFPSRFLGQ